MEAPTMFVVVKMTGGQGTSNLIVYANPAWTSRQLAEAWIASSAVNAGFEPYQVYNLPTFPPGVTLTPVPVAVGNVVVAWVGVDPLGGLAIYLYGTFASVDQARGWIAGRPYPGDCVVRMVMASPA
jgi:hypothetical protein